jgi:protein-tyrosine phosphatase
VIDVHCHVLPGLDDGPGTVEQARALVRGAREDGIETIVATPHVGWSHPGVDAARIASEVRALQPRLDVDVRLLAGAEVEATLAVQLDDRDLRALTLGRGGCLLLECPHRSTQAPGFAGIARSLAWRGHRVLLAHPERCPIFLRSPALLEELVDEGLLAQVTAQSLRGRYGRTVRDLAQRMLTRGTAHVVASDGHGPGRPARIAAELRPLGLPDDLVEWLTSRVPAALLDGEPLPARPKLIQRRRLAALRALTVSNR